MSDDLVSRLRDDRHCNDWYLRQSAATALTEARAEIERLRRDKSAGFAFWRSIAKRFCNARKAALDRAATAESELSTLRARVREVVGPIADQAGKYDPDEGDSHEHAWGRLDLTIGHLRAARQLMEEVK